MVKHKIILISVVCLSMVVLAGQRPHYMPPRLPMLKPGMTSEEYKKEFRKAIEQHRWQEIERNKEYIDFLEMQAWPRLLQISKRQWINIKPKFEKVQKLLFQSRVGAGSGGRDMEKFHWNRPSESYYGPVGGKARNQMPEGYRIVEEFIDLMEDEKSTDESIRRKIDALQQAREKAQITLSEAKKELAAVLTTPRQEAVFLLMGFID